jgi:hypothetical protein
MKQIISILLVACAINGLATVITVSNSPATIAQFNNINTAVTAAANGDTIYIHGSPNPYFAFTQTSKRLTFIGPGWSADKSLAFTASIPGCTITGTGCNSSEYQGLVFTSTINISSAKPDSLKFIRNHFVTLSISANQGGVTYSSYLFEGNIFDNSSVDATSGSTYQNFLFQNNYFFENGTVRDGNISSFFNSVNVLFDHNVWIGPGSGTRNCFSSNCRFLTLTNNIFVRRNGFNSNSSSNFNNNITFYPAGSTNPGAPWLANGNVDGGGNVDNQDPQMANQAAVNAGNAPALGDFSIAGGPANNSGSDAKDMGFLFDASGSLNWANSRNSRLPRIFSMNVTTPTIPAGGTVSISVNAKVSN